MSHFTLKAAAAVGTTTVFNVFLDDYMPGANGEYVKVYLCLLRCFSEPSRELSMSGLADMLDCTESDIFRAFKYWEKQGILKLEYNASHVLLGVCLRKPAPVRKTDRAASREPVATATQVGLATLNPASEASVCKTYSQEQPKEAASQSERKQLLFVCEQYMKKSLSVSEMERILYFYDELHFSADLIEYLVEYCVVNGNSGMRYIEKVGLSWAEKGITTVTKAKEYITAYHNNTYAVMKAFGINDRKPVQSELTYIEKWLKAFSLDLVLEACRRTMDRLHNPSFDYADKILKKWSDKDVRALDDVEKLDREYQEKTSSRKKQSAAKPTGFTNFQQRDYDFDELEALLLQSQKR